MKWVTRQHVHVDRVACPWLIRRFVDPDAEFLFVPSDQVDKVAAETGAVPFDAPGVELGHHEDKCSFDAIIAKYKLRDESLQDLAGIVRGADTENYGLAPESIGLSAIADGAMMITRDDNEAIEKGAFVYESLYAYCRLRHIREKEGAALEKMSKEKRRMYLKARIKIPDKEESI